MIDPNHTIRETVGVFTDADTPERAISELEVSGFERRHLSMLGHEGSFFSKRFGDLQVPTRELEDDPGAPRSPDIGTEELAIGQGALVGGSIFAGVVTALLATGGLAVAPGAAVTTALLGGTGGAGVGGVLAKLLGDKYASYLKERLDQGGIILWVQTPDSASEVTAKRILENHGAYDVHVHTLPAPDPLET